MGEPIEAFEPGTIERRKHKRMETPLRVFFKEVSAEGLQELQKEESWVPAAGQESADRKAFQTRNVSPGGLMLEGELELLGDRPLLPGTCLEVEMEVSQLLPVHAIAQVIWSRIPEDPRKSSSRVSSSWPLKK
jgi:hypothetical protein